MAALLSALFRSTDLVPSDVLAGCVLLRVKQKRESRELRRIHMLSDEAPKFSADAHKVFAMAPRWMSLAHAQRYLRLSMAAYGWPFVIYTHCGSGLCRLLRRLSCAARRRVEDDTCCFCHLAGVRQTAQIPARDVLFASFRNHVFELPFCVVADHQTGNIVLAIRGSISLRDVFTDLTATSARFEAEGVPGDTMAHKGMIEGAAYIERKLRQRRVLRRALLRFPHYGLVLTGHSLGAGVACLLGFKLRPRFPELKVYAFCTPGERALLPVVRG